MMDPRPSSRITIKEALDHEWFKVALGKGDRKRDRAKSRYAENI